MNASTIALLAIGTFQVLRGIVGTAINHEDSEVQLLSGIFIIVLSGSLAIIT